MTIRIRREGGRTRVSVRSKSRSGSADFGQNARNIRLFLTELDRELFGVGASPDLVYTHGPCPASSVRS